MRAPTTVTCGTVIAIPEVHKESRGDLRKTTKAAVRAIPICLLAPVGGGSSQKKDKKKRHSSLSVSDDLK